MKLLDDVKAEAVLSVCGTYRYMLTRRRFPVDETVVWIILTHPDPIGSVNDEVIDSVLRAPKTKLVVAAWGAHEKVRDRGRTVADMVVAAGHDLYCLGRTKVGQPRHPLYVKGGTPTEVWKARVRPRWPKNPEEWQEAADAASFSLVLDAAWQYGLIAPDPQVNVERCEWFLREAKARGIEPRSLEELLP